MSYEAGSFVLGANSYSHEIKCIPIARLQRSLYSEYKGNVNTTAKVDTESFLTIPVSTFLTCEFFKEVTILSASMYDLLCIDNYQ